MHSTLPIPRSRATNGPLNLWAAALLTACAQPPSTPLVSQPPVPAPSALPDAPVPSSLEPSAPVEAPPPPQLAPIFVPAQTRPVPDPLGQTPQSRYLLGEGILNHLSRGQHWLWTPSSVSYHLEASEPIVVTPDRQVLVGGVPCDLGRVVEATAAPYALVCPGLWRRNPVKGRKSKLEWGADFLRDHVKGGEAVTRFVKQKVVRHKGKSSEELSVHARSQSDARPESLAVERTSGLTVEELGLPLHDSPSPLVAGTFYEVQPQPGIWVAAIQPGLTPPLAGHPLDRIDAESDALLVLFQLPQFELDFALGTDHPRLGWADRVLASQRTVIRGPDGFDAPGPLVRTGAVRPDRGPSVVAVFTGGFKRSHGAFHRGPLSTQNQGSHYGFVEDGIVWSQPQPGLATLLVTWDGEVDIAVWQASHQVEDYRHVRQNGVPLVQDGQLGSQVFDFAQGNWSGSVKGNARSMRAGLCVRGEASARELLYGYFTEATPGAMAQVFLAAGCDQAMLTDMNALEHTYLAVHERRDGQLITHNLDKGMAVLDLMTRDQVVMPRFLALPDNRDFFSVRRR